jgi:hypothetical protein
MQQPGITSTPAPAPAPVDPNDDTTIFQADSDRAAKVARPGEDGEWRERKSWRFEHPKHRAEFLARFQDDAAFAEQQTANGNFAKCMNTIRSLEQARQTARSEALSAERAARYAAERAAREQAEQDAAFARQDALDKQIRKSTILR